jgi:lysophospholipase L1-like esterase
MRLMLRLLTVFAVLTSTPVAADAPRWTGAWASSQQIAEPNNALPEEARSDVTIRQIVRLTAGGPEIRVRLSNVHGAAPVTFTKVHVARPMSPDSPRIDPATDRVVTFAGEAQVVVPAGAEYVSDPVALPVRPLTHLAVSFHVAAVPERQTSHPGSRATSYVVRGQRTGEADLPNARRINHWYLLSAVDVPATRRAAAIVTFGDSIADGFGVQPNTDTRWPDFLATRLQASPATRHLAVLNHGIGGNRLLNDGTGPNGLARFDRDVLGQSGVRYLVILLGVNDLGTLTRDAPATPEAHAALVNRMISAYSQLATRARGRRIKVIGATILPYAGNAYYHPDALNEADRQAVNAWIRTPGNFDAVIDFDAIMRDPARPDRLNPAYDSGDHLHPSIAGYRAMAAGTPLSLFRD